MYNKEIIAEQSKIHDSFYLYDEERILQSINRLKDNFKGIKFLYSAKTNPHREVVKCVLGQGFGVDAASVHEAILGKENNVAKADNQYSTPGKTKKNIEDTIDFATIIADSLNEIKLIDEVAKAKGIIANIGVRINPDFTFFAEKGIANKFGIDEALFFDHIGNIKNYKNIEITGLHIHVRSQELDEKIILNYYKNLLTLAEKFQAKIGRNLAFLNMGSGIGIAYEKEDKDLNIESLATKSLELINKFSTAFKDTQLYIETGRYVIGQNGVYVTKVLDKKVSYGKTFVVLNNTLNGFFRPSIAKLVNNYSKEENPPAYEPLYTTKNPSQIFALNNNKEEEVVHLVGNLCTAGDIVASDITLPKLEIGDYIICTNAGSYAAVLSPMQFSSQIPPKELFLQKNGRVA